MSRRRPFREKLVIGLALLLGLIVAWEGLKRLAGSLDDAPQDTSSRPVSRPAAGTLELSETQEAVGSVPRPRR